MAVMSVLSTATRGLAAAQVGMDITGQNIANADVEGYSRKRLNQAAAYRYDGEFGQFGYGVEVINIERVRNTYIDQQIRRQNREVGYFDEIDHTYETIENIFTEPSDTGLLQFVDQFFDSWENLANNPSEPAARNMVKTNAEILTEVFHNLSGELQLHRITRNDEIANRVERINRLTQEIYNLNLEISAVEISNQNANDSRDRRDVLLKELSELIDISTTENELGQVSVSTSGNIIVSPVDIQKLEITTTTFRQSDGSNGADVGVRFATSKRKYVPSGGQLKGLFDARDQILPEYQQKLDAFAVALTEKVNEVHRSGYNLLGYNGIEFFDSQVTGASDISLSASIRSDVKNIAAAKGGEIRDGTATVTTTFGAQPEQIIDSTSGNAARNILRNSLTAVNTTTGQVLTEGIDYHIDYARGTMQLLNNLHDSDPVDLTYRTNIGGFRGEGDNENAIEIAQLRHSLTMDDDAVGNPTATFDQYYSAFIGVLGLSRNEAESNLKTRNFLIQQYETTQDSIAGVSLDEEIAELIKYQHTYQASARVISTADRMLEILMNI